MKQCSCGAPATIHREYADGSCGDYCQKCDPCRTRDYDREAEARMEASDQRREVKYD